MIAVRLGSARCVISASFRTSRHAVFYATGVFQRARLVLHAEPSEVPELGNFKNQLFGLGPLTANESLGRLHIVKNFIQTP